MFSAGDVKNVLVVFLWLFVCSVSHADGEMVDELYIEASGYYGSGDYPRALDVIQKAKAMVVDVADFPSIYVLSGMIQFKVGDCEGAVVDAGAAKALFDEMSVLMEQRGIEPIGYMGVGMYASYNDNYYLATKVVAFCSYKLGDMEEARKSFSYIEHRWPARFDYRSKTRFAHTLQSLGNDSSAVTYYLSALAELGSVGEEMVQGSKSLYVESTRYNLVISYWRMGDVDNASSWGERLLSETESPMYWINKMDSDPDYVGLLSDERFAEVVSQYQARRAQ